MCKHAAKEKIFDRLKYRGMEIVSLMMPYRIRWLDIVIG